MNQGTAATAGQQARRATQSGPLDRLARVGFAIYGVIHFVLGLLAMQLAWGGGGEASESGAFAALAGTGLGKALLWLGVVGFAALTLWSLSNAIFGSRDRDGSRRLVETLKNVGRSVVFGGFAVLSGRYALGGGSGGGSSGGGSEDKEEATATLFTLPGGEIIVAAIGAFIVGLGAYFAYKGLSQRFLDDLRADASSGASGGAVKTLGSIGYPAKGVALAIIGLLFVVAAVQHDPDDVGGLDQALKTLRDQPFGPWLLTVVAVGIAAYGLYSFARARYQRI